ncbi:energy-coupling factor ABC transporter ATP-binding protein [Oceanivirga salmonicida]|uniref:energy-coupling factor ABC transporter ATP-binding protein n=1 Tax=Oceanivirga salmonicida TaxID=1769291 RepID=UPI0012E242D8|nr:ABC transporter ATP-binding protein [Oceanivirga salmonicida]
MVNVKNVSFKYNLSNDIILNDISFEIKKGEFVGLLGKNGVGKTTLCTILRGLIPEYVKGKIKGVVEIDGKNIKEYETGTLSKKIGFVFQNPFIQISGIKKTVFEEIAFGLENLGVPREEIIEKVENIIKKLNLEDLKDKNPNKLSGGQSQKVALASVLVMEPELLIVDEPTSQLDPVGTEDVFEILKILKQEEKTVLLVEHKIDLIAEYTDKVLVLNEGKIVLDGKTKDILSDEKIEEYGLIMPQAAKISNLLKMEEKCITLETLYNTLKGEQL